MIRQGITTVSAILLGSSAIARVMHGTDLVVDFAGAPSGPPEIRASTASSASSSTFTAPVPAGTQVGDTLILTVGGGWEVISINAGWAPVSQLIGTNANGSTWTKVADSTDLSAGVTCVFNGSFAYGWTLTAFVGTVGLREHAHSRYSSGSTSRTLTCVTNQADDLVFVSGYVRGNIAGAGLTLNIGTRISDSNRSSVSIAAFVVESPDATNITATFIMPAQGAGGNGSYQVMIPVYTL